MKKNAYFVCVIALTVILQENVNVFAKIYAASSAGKTTTKSLSSQKTLKSDGSGSSRLRTIRVTESTDGEALVSHSNNSSFNLDSTRFIITIDGVPTLYSFDPDRLSIRKEGALFNSTSLRFDSFSWSAEDPDTLLCLSDGSNSQSSTQLYSYNVTSKEFRLTKDFSGALSVGEARLLNKSQSDDDHIILAWRETASLPWQYVAVWDRQSDRIFLFDITDPISGVTGFTGAHFDRTGQKLVVSGESTRIWDYQNQPQHYSELQSNGLSSIDRLYSTASPTDLQVQDPSALFSTTSHLYIGVEPVTASKVGWMNSSGSFVYRRTLTSAELGNSKDVIAINWRGEELSRSDSPELNAGAWFFERTSGELYLRLPNGSVPGSEGEIVIGRRKTTDSDVIKLARNNGASAEILSNNGWKSAPYLRGNVSPDGQFFIFNSKADKKRSDVFILPITAQAVAEEPVEWTNVVNCTVDENSLSKSTASSVEDAGALSLQTIESGNGYIQVETTERNSSRFFGLTTRFVAPPKSLDMDFGIQLGSDRRVSITEKGIVKRSGIKYAVGNTFRIAIQGDVVKYYKNQKLIYTSSEAIQYPLIASASLISSSAKIDSAMISGAAAQPRVSINPTKITLDANQSKQFTAAVSGTKDTRVAWSATGGTVSSNGLYVAPSNGGTDTVTAALVADPSVHSAAMVIVNSSGGDSTPPVISQVSGTGVSASSANVVWATNEASDSQVEYGLTTGYGSSSSLDSRLVTSHSMSLSGLLSNRTYNFRVKSRDAAGNLSVSGNFTFSTSGAADTTPPAISSVTTINVTATSATVTWTSNEASDSQLEFGTSSTYGSATPMPTPMVTNHSVTLNNLSPSTTYNYRAKSRDGSGNLGITTNFTFSTAAVQAASSQVVAYAFNEGSGSTAADASGSGFNGTVSGSTWTAQGKYGNALSFDGINDKVATSNVTLGNRFTMMAWVNNPSHSPFEAIASIGNTRELHLRNGVIAFYTGSTRRTFSSAIPANSWQHVAITYDGSKLRAYLNGVLRGSASSISLSTATGSLQVGARPTGTADADMFSGMIDEVQILGTDLSATEIQAAMNTPISGGAAPPDTTPPSIGGINSSSITSSSASITWSTDEASDTQVEYGPTTSYGSSSPLNTSMVTGHAVTLSGLASSTDYNFRVRSRDAAGNLAVSGNFTFRTAAAADTTPPSISGVSSSSITHDSATISWTTNEGSDTQVEYGTTTSYGSSSPLNTSIVTAHSASLSGLAASTTYNYRVKSRDAAGNLATSGNFTFTTTAAPDTTPPVISQVAASNLTSSSATVTWTTNEPGNTQVEYGLTTSYGSLTPLNTSLVTAHSIVVAGLAANTTYNYRVRSRDAAGNLATSANFTFKTSVAADATPPIISSINVTNITTDSATITWTTNEASDTQVDYGTTTSYGASTPLPTPLATSHSATLTGLSAITTYNYRVKSRDAAGNLAVSGNLTFTTPAPLSQYIEAEVASITSPMSIGSDPLASGGQFITTTTQNNGTASYSVSVPASGTYYLWGRIISPNSSSDSFFVSIDGAAEDVYDTAEGVWSTNWQWTQVRGRGSSGAAAQVQLTIVENNPEGGLHTVQFRGRELNSKLDRLFITSDPNGSPSGSPLPPSATLSAVSVNPSSVTGGSSSQGTVTLSSAAPTGGAVVSLSSSNTSAATVPASVTVGAGATSANFTVSTSSVASSTNVTISGSFGGSSRSATLTVQAPAPPSSTLSTLTLSASSVVSLGTVQGTVNISSAAPSGGASVTLSSSNTGVATVPASVTVGAGSTSATFTVTSKSVATATSVSITGSLGGVSRSATLTVQPPPPPTVSLSSLILNPTSVTGVGTSQGTVTLSGSAPSGGAVVSLTSSNTGAATVPASVTVAAGSTSATFTVSTKSVSSVATSSISGSYGSVSRSATLTVNPPAAPPPSGQSFYVATNGSPSGNGSISSPWDLQTALNQPSSVLPGATIYMRGGTYKGKFKSSLTGTASSPITVQSYPGEWAVIDGYATTTLASAMNSSQNTLTLADASSFPNGSEITIADQSEPSSQEQMSLNAKSGNSFNNVMRGWNGTPRLSHASGALVILGGNQLTISGTRCIYRDFEIKNSDPVRTQTTPNSQNSPHLRGEGLMVLGPLNSFVNLAIHDCQEGVFIGTGGFGSEVYGCVIYNNGYVAGGAYNGHGMYVLHSDTANTLYIKENIVFNNSAIGIKDDSQNGDSVNIWHEGVVSFNNGSWAQSTERRWQLLAGSNNGIADRITVKNCFFFVPNGYGGEQLRLGIGDIDNGRADVTGNYIMGGGQSTNIERWSPLTFTGNTIYTKNNLGGGNSLMTLYTKRSGTPSVVWNNNTYFNGITNARGYYTPGSSPMTFPTWKSSTGLDPNSTETTSIPSSPMVFVRPNSYQAGRGNIIIYNFSGASTVNADVSSILNVGDSYSVYAAENYLGTPVLTGVYSGGSISVPLSAGSIAQPVGWGTAIATVRPNFGVYIIRKN